MALQTSATLTGSTLNVYAQTSVADVRAQTSAAFLSGLCSVYTRDALHQGRFDRCGCGSGEAGDFFELT